MATSHCPSVEESETVVLITTDQDVQTSMQAILPGPMLPDQREMSIPTPLNSLQQLLRKACDLLRVNLHSESSEIYFLTCAA